MTLINVLKIEILPFSCTSSNIAMVIKSRRMRRVGPLVCGEGTRIWVGKPEGRRLQRKCKCRWENVPEIKIKCIVYEGMD
jgi:hypothetical protein